MKAKANNLAVADPHKAAIFSLVAEYLSDHADIEISLPDEEVTKHLSPLSQELGNLRDELSAMGKNLRKEIKEKASQIVVVEVRKEGAEPVKVEGAHKQFAELLGWVAAGVHVNLVGPAGSGKTTGAEQVAKALGLPFHFTGAVASEFKLTGFVDAQGKYHTTPFRKWCEEGGVFLWDEVDASDARALLSFNAALANGLMEFPDGAIVRLHKTCIAIAAANTWGQGADRVYIGRNQLDGASLDRFACIEWGYDEALEARIASNPKWTAHVQKVRAAVASLKIRAVVSPRASIFGGKALAQGLTWEQAEKGLLWKGLDSATVEKIRAAIR